MRNDGKIDRLLAQHFRNNASAERQDREAAARVLAALRSPLPPQRRAWRHWPAVLLDWNFMPAWPRVAALAGCAVIGFAIGAAGPNLHKQDAAQAQRGELQLVAFAEPEPMTGVLP